MSKLPLPPIYMSAKDVAQHFGCGVSTVWRWKDLKVIPQPVKIGGLTRWRREQIEAVGKNETAA